MEVTVDPRRFLVRLIPSLIRCTEHTPRTPESKIYMSSAARNASTPVNNPCICISYLGQLNPPLITHHSCKRVLITHGYCIMTIPSLIFLVLLLNVIISPSLLTTFTTGVNSPINLGTFVKFALPDEPNSVNTYSITNCQIP